MSEVDFARITAATILIPIAVAIWQRKSLNEPLRVFFWYRVFALLFNIVQHLFFWFANKYYEDIKDYLDWWGIQDTSFLSILFYINDFIFIGWFYYLLLRYNRYGNYIKWLSTILLIIVLINYLFIEGYQIFGKFNPTAVAIFVFGVAFFYLWHLYKSHLVLPILKNPYFWMSFGLIIPHLIGFFLYATGDLIHKENYSFFVSLSTIKNGFLIIAQILFAIGFWNARYAKYISLGGNEDTLAQNKTED